MTGAETPFWLPLLVAFCISALTSTGGITGAFIILPFQISVLGYSAPGASATNLLYNVIAVPLGAYRYHRERRMQWGLAMVTGIGAMPGLVVGAYLRVNYLPDPVSFKFFAGLVLLALAIKMLIDLLRKRRQVQRTPSDLTIQGSDLTLRSIQYEFDQQRYRVPTISLALFSVLVGVIGGVYGIGGAAVLSPYLVAVYHLPVHSIAGAMLMSTWITSVAGVVVYVVIGLWFSPEGSLVLPDWQLGLALGCGGLAGIYAGAWLQRWVPAGVIKVILIAGLLLIAVRYIVGFIR
ncbi:TSUP family transporter [candidate division GN15 bacterium]|nr:TSUP family transporter [candidate division GN15 bacterium]